MSFPVDTWGSAYPRVEVDDFRSSRWYLRPSVDLDVFPGPLSST